MFFIASAIFCSENLGHVPPSVWWPRLQKENSFVLPPFGLDKKEHQKLWRRIENGPLLWSKQWRNLINYSGYRVKNKSHSPARFSLRSKRAFSLRSLVYRIFNNFSIFPLRVGLGASLPSRGRKINLGTRLRRARNFIRRRISKN